MQKYMVVGALLGVLAGFVFLWAWSGNEQPAGGGAVDTGPIPETAPPRD